MIYVDNDSTYSQRVFIPRNEELMSGDVTGHTFTLQEKNYEIHENGVTRIHPDAGVDGISAGTISVYVSAATGVTFEHLDVTEDGIYVPTGDSVYTGVTVQVYDKAYQDGYHNGYSDGYQSGYTRGHAEGYSEGYASGQTDGYASGSTDGFAEGYASGHTDGYQEGRNDGYSDGYASGSTDGYQEGYRVGYAAGFAEGRAEGYQAGLADGAEQQKALLTGETFTENGEYTRENGWSAVTISVPDGPYQEGYQDGVAHQKSLLSSATITENGLTITSETGYSAVTANLPMASILPKLTSNGVYTFSPYDYNLQGFNGLEVTVEVPTSGGSSILTAITATENGVYNPPTGFDGFSSFRVNVELDTATTYNRGFSDGYNSGTTDGYSSGYTEGVAWRDAQDISGVFYENGTYRRQNGYGWKEVNVSVDTSSTYTSGYTDGSNYQKSLLGSTAFTSNGTFTKDSGWSSVTVNVGMSSIGSLGATATYGGVTSNPMNINTTSVATSGWYTQEIDGAYDVCGCIFRLDPGQQKTVHFYTTKFNTCPRFSNSYLTSFVMSDDLTVMGRLESSTRLTAVTLSNSLTSFPVQAFDGCMSLPEITIPSGITELSDHCFRGCSALTSITCYATTAPIVANRYAFMNVSQTGVLHVPSGSDYSSWLTELGSGWTIQYI